MYEITKADVSDSPRIRWIAEQTWPAAYGHIISPGQLRYMLDLFYSEESLSRQMKKDAHRFILLRHEDRPVGFASFSLKNQSVPGHYRLHKLYVLPDYQGKGAGRFLLEEIFRNMREEQALTLELNVNRHNTARYFYEKLGFHIQKEEDIDIGFGYFMNDYVMELRF